jgi:sulfur carrier protein ThiS
MKNFFVFLSCIMLFACKKTEVQPPPPVVALYFPPVSSAKWETTSPTSLNWDTSKLPALYNYLQQDTRAFIVLKDGNIVLEKYFGQNVQSNGAFIKVVLGTGHLPVKLLPVLWWGRRSRMAF